MMCCTALLTSGEYARQHLEQSFSPSMDITVSSNFRAPDVRSLRPRCCGRLITSCATSLPVLFSCPTRAMSKAGEKSVFSSHCVSDDETCRRDCRGLGALRLLARPPQRHRHARGEERAGAIASQPMVTLGHGASQLSFLRLSKKRYWAAAGTACSFS